jgi:hypothetical protein
MGGDGGVIASNRRYMRGAGTADHTGDGSSGPRGGGAKDDPAVVREQRRRDFRTCAVSGQPLDYSFSASAGSRVVACPYGRLYDKERAIQALLDKDERLSHVRGLKDLAAVRFHLLEASASPASDPPVPACPITGKELNGLIPAYVIVPGAAGQPNAVSERGLAMKELVEDYGPVERTVRLFPPPEELEKIKEEREKEAAEKKRKREKDKAKPHKKEKQGRRESHAR